MRHLGLWTLSNLPSIGVGQRLTGVGPGLERVPGNRRGRGHADPDKRGLAAIVRHGDAMIRHPCNTLVGGPSGCGKSTWTRGLLRHVVTLGMVQHGVRPSTLSHLQEGVHVGRLRLHHHKDPAQ